MLMPGWSREETTVPALIAHSHFHLAVFYAALFACFAPEWYGSLFHRVERGANIRDRGSHLALLATVSAGIIAAFGFVFGSPATAIAWHQHVLFWIGIAVMLAGLVFRWYAIHSLGRFFTRTVATRAGQYVVDSGPYRLIRHPSYTGGLLMFLGTGVAMTNWAARCPRSWPERSSDTGIGCASRNGRCAPTSGSRIATTCFAPSGLFRMCYDVGANAYHGPMRWRD